MAAISKGPPQIYRRVIDVVVVIINIRAQSSLPEFKRMLYPVLVFRSEVEGEFGLKGGGQVIAPV